MKTTGLNLALLSMITIALDGCSLGASYHAQLTSLNVGCNADEVKTSHERYQLNETETWTAECDGKTYDCEYYPDGEITSCYLRED